MNVDSGAGELQPQGKSRAAGCAGVAAVILGTIAFFAIVFALYVVGREARDPNPASPYVVEGAWTILMIGVAFGVGALGLRKVWGAPGGSGSQKDPGRSSEGTEAGPAAGVSPGEPAAARRAGVTREPRFGEGDRFTAMASAVAAAATVLWFAVVRLLEYSLISASSLFTLVAAVLVAAGVAVLHRAAKRRKRP